MSRPIVRHERQRDGLLNDAMLRRITESVRISHVKEDELIITKAECNIYQSRELLPRACKLNLVTLKKARNLMEA